MASDHGPIEPKQTKIMSALAHALDDLLNDDKEHREIGFALLMFNFNTSVTGDDRMNYISNAGRADMLIALKLLVAQFEGRVSSDEGHG